MMMPDNKVEPLVNHCAALDDTLKYTMRFGIILAVTVVDIELIKAAASNVASIPVRCMFDICFSCFITKYASF